MIIVISHPDDRHAVRVLERLAQRGEEAHLLDLADLPHHATLALDFEHAAKPVARLRRDTGEVVRLTDATAVWWRRPQSPKLDTVTDPSAHGFVYGEWNEAVYGLYELMDCPWMNPPTANESASRKAYQLKVASRLGMAVPDTLMTSDRDEAMAFVDRLGLEHVIYKIFGATLDVWRETRRLTLDDLPMLDTLDLAPVIFQELVPAQADVRITVVGERVFPMAIDSRATSYDVDFRVTLGDATTSAIELPDDVHGQVLTLMEELGLAYGAIDMRLTPEGEYVFLEINPAGEFLFSEAGTGFPITDAMADWLSRPDAPGR